MSVRSKENVLAAIPLLARRDVLDASRVKYWIPKGAIVLSNRESRVSNCDSRSIR